jgi:hypothetical protein
MSATPDYAAMWNDLHDELTRRRDTTFEVAGDLDDEGKPGAERTYGRAEGLRDTVACMDLMADRAARYADLDERHAAAMAVLGECSIELGPQNDLSLDQIEALAEVARSWDAEASQ